MNSSIKKVVAEFIGTFVFLLAIAGAIASGSPNKQLSLALVLGLMILTLGGISGGHFNPVVSIYFFAKKELPFGMLFAYIIAQLTGAFLGVAAGLGLWGFQISGIINNENPATPTFLSGEFFGEVVATAGLVFIIGTLIKKKQSNLIWIAVATWVFAAGTFTITGAMANPAVIFGLMFAGYSPQVVSMIMVAQLIGLLVAIILLSITGAESKEKVIAEPEAAKPTAAMPVVTTPVVAKRTVTKKAVAKKAPAKKAAASKTVAKKAAAKKAPAKKTPVKKAPAKKSSVRR